MTPSRKLSTTTRTSFAAKPDAALRQVFPFFELGQLLGATAGLPSSAVVANSPMIPHCWASQQWHSNSSRIEKEKDPAALRRRRPRRCDRRGMLLVVVLIVVAMLAVAAATYAQLMSAEHEAAVLNGRGLQARALADSGIEAVKQLLAQEKEHQLELGGHYDNPDLFQGVLVVDGPESTERGRFTVLSPRMDEEGRLSGGVRYGLEDESSRLNLNALLVADAQQENGGRELLMALPGMNEERADAIMDWIDEDEEPREFGAEVEYYATLDPPYAPKNGPLESIEELLLVRDITPTLLFGLDANRNGVVDPGEIANEALMEEDNSDGELDRGLSAYFTLYSLEANLNPDGEPKIDLNAEDLEQLYDELEEVLGSEWATFIIAYRQSGPYNGTLPSGSSSGQLDFERSGGTKLATVLDLIGPRVQVQFKNQEEQTILNTPFPDAPVAMALYLPKLMDYVAVNTQELIPGRININQAPRAVLMGIPGMDEEVVGQIISERVLEPTADLDERRHETWILGEGIVTVEQMKQMLPFVTGGGSVFRTQIVGFFDETGPPARVEVIVDSSGSTPRLLVWREISHLGRGYPLETLGGGATMLPSGSPASPSPTSPSTSGP